MPFENYGTLQKQHMTNTTHTIDKYDTHRKWYLKKNKVQLLKNVQRSFTKG